MDTNKIYDSFKVIKPWGEEHVIYRNKKKISITLLKIKYLQSTSLHCHPSKKTGFILLDGKAKVKLGLEKDESKIFHSPSKIIIRSGLFHSIKSISKKGLIALEFESPADKNDLVRLSDNYGRKFLKYEKKKAYLKRIQKEDLKISIPFSKKVNSYKIKNRVLNVFNWTGREKISKYKNSIFAILNGEIKDKNNLTILGFGDVIMYNTLKIIKKNFKIKKKLTLLTVK